MPWFKIDLPTKYTSAFSDSTGKKTERELVKIDLN